MASPALFVRDPSSRRYVPAPPKVVATVARNLALQDLRKGASCTSPSVVGEFLVRRMRGLEHEIFACLFLDNRHRLIEYVELFRGTIDGASVHPREVVKAALQCNAIAVIFAHNHPSGVAEQSMADEAITKRLQAALALIDIRVIDHMIVGGGGKWMSFAERGLL